MLKKIKRLKDILIFFYVVFRHFFEWAYIYFFLHGKVKKSGFKKQNNKNFLIVSQKWSGGVQGSSNNDISMYMRDTFIESKIGNLTEFFIDDFCYENDRKHVHSELKSLILKNNINHIVVFLDSSIVNLYNLFSINYLSKVFNLRMFILVPDSIWFYNQLLIMRFNKTASKIVTLDSNYFLDSKLVKNSEKFIHLYQPLPKSQYNLNNHIKDIDVLFIGRLNGRSSRKVYIDYLIKKGLNVLHIFSDSKNFITMDEYISLTSRAKILLNFSFTGKNDEYIQLKARPFEASLMGSLLIENESKVINRYFEPNEEYIPFNSKETLYEAVVYFLENPEDRKKIAMKANKKALKCYSAKLFWTKLLS